MMHTATISNPSTARGKGRTSVKSPVAFRDFLYIEGCPSDAIIFAWYWAVRDHGLARGIHYSAAAIAGFVKNEFHPYGTEHDYIRDTILWYGWEIGERG